MAVEVYKNQLDLRDRNIGHFEIPISWKQKF